MSEPKSPTKVVGRRVVAVILDLVVVMVPCFAIFFQIAEPEQLPAGNVYFGFYTTIGQATAGFGDQVFVLRGAAANLFTLASMVWAVGLLILIPGRTGWSLGKLLLGIRVLGADGRPAGFWRSFLRELLWIVDGFPYLIPGLTGFVIALSSDTNQRLGDKVANTWVVGKGAVPPAQEPQPPPAFTQPQPPPA